MIAFLKELLVFGFKFAGPWPKAVSDHEHLFAQLFLTIPCLLQISSKNGHCFRKGSGKGPMPGKELRNGLKNEQLLLFLAQIVVYCSEKRAREWGCQGTPGYGHSPPLVRCLTQGGALF